MKLRYDLIVAVLVVLAAISGSIMLKVERDREWAHGGDAMKVGVEVRLADAASFQSILVALGVPSDCKADILPDEQAVVVRVSWVGAKQTNGSFKLIGLDKRVVRPRCFLRHILIPSRRVSAVRLAGEANLGCWPNTTTG